ncbi:twin-arginine translocation signal domain-containing protein, partial [Candidatus Latescibacterota bacterium]
MKRRDVMKRLALGTAAGATGILERKDEALAETYSKATRGLPPLKITNVKAILTAPRKTAFMPFVIVKVETSEPGLYGLGCASLYFNPLAVITVIEKYMNDFAKGKDPDNIEDIWQCAYVSTNWRNGPV